MPSATMSSNSCSIWALRSFLVIDLSPSSLWFSGSGHERRPTFQLSYHRSSAAFIRMNANAARRANCPSVHQLLVFCREAAIGSPVHVPRLRRDLVDFGAASPTKTLPQFFDLIERALICWLP